MTFKSILDEIENNLNRVLSDMSVFDVPFTVESAKPGFGDVSSNIAYLLAKRLKKSPKEIAEILSEKYSGCTGSLVSSSKAHPSGYLNFFANWEKLGQLILSESYLDTCGDVDIGNGSAIVVEHTSVNPNKALHIGHIRNIIIGDTVSRILKKANYKVNVLNYIDDSGLQVADIVIGFKHFGYSQEPPAGKKFDHYCGDDVYVKTTKKYGDDPKLEQLRRSVLKELEDGDSETAKFADAVTKRVLAGQLETCWNLDVTYDCLNFESQILRSGLWNNVFEKLKEMKLIELETEGDNTDCWMIRDSDMEKDGGKNNKKKVGNEKDRNEKDRNEKDRNEKDRNEKDRNEKDKVIVRSNGTATYVAKDIPYAAWKLGLLDDPFHYKQYEKTQPNSQILWQTTLDKSDSTSRNFTGQKVITVIDSRQAGLQKIITFLMGKFKSVPDAYIHLGYESVTLSSATAGALGLDTGGKQAQMSGRKGLYVSADSIYDLLKEKILNETRKRHPEMPDSEIQHIAHCVCVGTLRYEMIKQDLDKIITFDLAKSLSLEGDTATYVQYTSARASRILEKSGRVPSIDVDFSLLKETSELDLIKNIGLFDIHVRDSVNNLSPKVIARYCHDLAVSFNSFYEKSKVLGSGDTALENSRLCLVNSFKIVLEKALDLLGIVAPDRM